MNPGKWALDDYEALNLRPDLIGTAQHQAKPAMSQCSTDSVSKDLVKIQTQLEARANERVRCVS